MKHYKLKLLSRNLKSLKSLLILLNSHFKVTNKKNLNNPKTKKILTILKSPHVTKSAQEQFESRYYCNILGFTKFEKKLIVLLKKIINRCHPDIYLKIRIGINNLKHKKYYFNPLNLFKKKLKIYFLENSTINRIKREKRQLKFVSFQYIHNFTSQQKS
jgi:ribosomal protein S10